MLYLILSDQSSSIGYLKLLIFLKFIIQNALKLTAAKSALAVECMYPVKERYAMNLLICLFGWCRVWCRHWTFLKQKKCLQTNVVSLFCIAATDEAYNVVISLCITFSGTWVE